MRTWMLCLAIASLASPQDVDFLAPAVIEGRFLDPNGTPIAGVELALHARFAPSSRGARVWTSPETRTDDAGRFVLRVLPTDAVELALTAEHESYAPTQWTWTLLASGQHENLGDLKLHPTGRVVGSVLGEDGALSIGPWTIDLRLLEAPRVGERGLIRRDYFAFVDTSTGEYRFEGVPIGRARVDARLAGTETKRTFVLVRPGMEEVLDLTFAGPDPALTIWVNWRFRPPSVGARVGTEPTAPSEGPQITLVSAEGERRVVRGSGVYGGSTRISDLRSTTYRVEIGGSNFESWTLDGVVPGDQIQADLVGSAALVLDVVDRENAIPVARYGAWVFSTRADGPGYELLDENTAPPADGVVDGFLPSSFVLGFSAPGYVPVRVAVDDLGPGERRPLRVELDRSRTLDVRVLGVDGAPVIDEPVEFLAEAGTEELVVRRELRTDQVGRARFEGLGTGLYTLVATHAPWLVSRTVLRANESGDVRDVPPPAHGWVDAHLLLPPNLDVTTLEFLPVDAESSGATRWAKRSPGSPGGSLRLGPLAPGVRELLVRYPTTSGAFVQLELGAIAVEAGDVAAASWDLRRHCPGWVTVDTPGEAPLDVVFRWTGGRPDRRARRHGEFLFAGLEPGSWQVLVRPVLGQWVWLRPDPVTIEPGQGGPLRLGLELVERTVRFVDGEGNPLGSVLVATGPAGDPVEALQRPRPDDEGRVRLTLPAGEVRFARRDGDPIVTVDWRAGSEELVVSLP